MNIELAEQCALGKACLEEGGCMVLAVFIMDTVSIGYSGFCFTDHP